MTTNKDRVSTALAAIAAFAMPASGFAGDASSLDIPSQDMVTAIAALGAETGLQILSADELLAGKTSASVKGTMSAKQALISMLNDNSLGVTELGDGTLVIVKADDVSDVSQDLVDEAFDIGTVLFRTSRGRVPINEVPRNVAVIEEEQLRRLGEQSGNLVETLPKVIPSYGPPQFRNSTRGVTLRGRAPLYLLDGIPVSTQTIQTLGFIDQFAVDSVEVLYGPTALYGNGAAGGVIQFFTVEPSSAPLETTLSFGVRSSISDGSAFDEDSFSYQLRARASGTRGQLGYVAGVSLERTNGFFQPGGERLGPGGLDDFDNASFYGKLTYDIDTAQRVEAFTSITRREARETDFIGVAQPDDPFETVAVFDPSIYNQPPEQSGNYFSLKYLNSDLAGGDFSIQAYYSDESTTDVGIDIRGGTLPPSFPTIFQTGTDLRAYGVRTDYAFDVSDQLRFNIGADYRKEERSAPLLISSEATFDPTNFYDAAITAQQFPDIEIESYGLFLQAAYDVSDRLTVEGGVRYDRFDYDVAPSSPAFAVPPGVRPGGTGDADDFSFNLGATFDINDSTTLFASYAQGFSLPFIDFAVTTVPPGVGVNDTSLVDPIKVNSYELGLRGNRGIFDYAFAVFYAESDFGSSIQLNADGTARLVRAPQRNYGFELATRAQVRDDLELSLGVAYNDGENDVNNDGDYDALPSLQVLPLSVSLGALWEYNDRLRFNGNMYYLSDRDRAFDDGVDGYELDGFVTVDVGLEYDVGPGTLSVQVNNLFDEFYLPPESQSRVGITNDRRTAGQGRALSLFYTATF